MSKRRLIFLVLAAGLAAGLAGCMRTSVLERLGLIIAVGFDELPDDKIQGTAVMYEIDPEAKERSNVVSSSAFTSKGSRTKENLKAMKTLASGQLRVVVYQRKLAESGLLNLADTLSRDSDIGSGIYLSIAEGTTQELLTSRLPEISNMGNYLFHLIRQNREEGLTLIATLHDFQRDYHEVGKDPALPYIVKRGNVVALDGAALFRDDRMVGLIEQSQIFPLLILRERRVLGIKELSVPFEKLAPFSRKEKEASNLHIVIKVGESSCKVKLATPDPDKPAFRISVKLQAQIIEISQSLRLEEKEAVKLLEGLIAERIKADMQALIRRTQELRSDPAGFGLLYRTSVRHSGLTRQLWSERYPKAEFEIDVKFKILRTGEIE